MRRTQQRTLPNPYPQLSKRSNRRLDHIPGDYGLPLLGYTAEMFSDLNGLIQRQSKQYGPVYKSATVFQRTINLLGPEANQFVLNDREKNFSSKLAWDLVLDKLFPNGLMLRDFDEHRYHRRILQQAFKKPVLARYVETMDTVISDGLESWPKNQYFCFFEYIKRLMLESAIELFLGEPINDQSHKLCNAFVGLVDSSLAVVRLPLPGTAWRRGMQGRKLLEQFFESRISQRRKNPGEDFFSQFCLAEDEQGNHLSDAEIADHMIFLLFAAHDTITSTFTSTVNLLLSNPDWQTELRREYQPLAGAAISYENLAAFKKTEWVLKESLRLHAPVPVIPRRAIRDCEFEGFFIPKNSGVCIHPPHSHRSPELWVNPDSFDPLRWSPDRIDKSAHPFQFIPFGGGAHKCLGLNFVEIQTKVFLYRLLSDYSLEAQPGFNMQYQQVPLRMPKNGLPIKLQRR